MVRVGQYKWSEEAAHDGCERNARSWSTERWGHDLVTL